MWGRNLVVSLLLMPMFMAPVIVGLLGRFLTDSTFGLYAWFLRETHIYTGDILGSPDVRLHRRDADGRVGVDAADRADRARRPARCPGPVLEAARVDGASYWQRLRYIVMPMIMGVVIVALLVRSMDAIRYFDIIYTTTNGGPADATKIVPIRLYETAFRFFDLGYAAAIGLSMLAVSILVANLFMRTLKRQGLAK